MRTLSRGTRCWHAGENKWGHITSASRSRVKGEFDDGGTFDWCRSSFNKEFVLGEFYGND